MASILAIYDPMVTGLSQANILVLLGQMTHDGLVQIRAVLCCIAVGESIKGLAGVACLAGI